MMIYGKSSQLFTSFFCILSSMQTLFYISGKVGADILSNFW